MATHAKGVKFLGDEPFIDLLYQSNRLYKDLMSAQKKQMEDNVRAKHQASMQNTKKAVNRNIQRRSR